MSDIYLQITETPTVVTLSTPVISGALSSTVTVANVVTVALDSNSLNALENVTVTVGAAVTISNFPATQVIYGTVDANVIQGSLSTVEALRDGDGNTFGLERDFPVSGTVTANIYGYDHANGTAKRIPIIQCADGVTDIGDAVPVVVASETGTVNSANPLPVSGTVTIGSALPSGTNRIGSVTASISGTVPVSGTFWQATQPVSLTSTTVTVSSLPALVAGTAQIGSVTASISGTVPISISSVTIGNSVTIGSCVTHGVTIANTVVTFTPAQGTTVANSNFTSTTASTSLVSADSGREVLTVFNEGAGNLHISPGGTCTTVAYQVRLSAGDYWECPAGQVTLAHTAVFATAGTARVSQTS